MTHSWFTQKLCRVSYITTNQPKSNIIWTYYVVIIHKTLALKLVIYGSNRIERDNIWNILYLIYNKKSYQSRNDGWKNMTVSSARLSNKPDKAENRIRNSPHCIGCWALSWYFCCLDSDVIDGLSLDKHSSDESKEFTELKSSTGVSGVRDANAVDNISWTYKIFNITQRLKQCYRYSIFI